MRTIGVRELKEHASEVLRRVREDGEVFEVTYHGRVVARVVPAPQPDDGASAEAFWEKWDQLAAEISERWPAGLSAVDAVREERR